ncbi:hypothetical protein BDFB_014645 [Asbolus verrucosus]|uniref:Mutator-like transposase domain-containing protein n=1 Tax=Asbolus verrucosus TaxID=1661398 RepID=A0A482VQQ3_ASBVE|nr:hypothetical protein BDFB_014645 [Asbolus verrucosus]
MDVKNRLCLTYKRKKPRQINKEHKCFMNWNKIATAMESNIILKRLQKSLTTHNLIYGKIIDGDSSVYKKIVMPNLIVQIFSLKKKLNVGIMFYVIIVIN